MSLLSVSELVVEYGAIRALHDISLEVEEGEMLTLIGANGAGKSTTLNAIVGQLGELGGRVVSGGIAYRGRNILGRGPSEIVRQCGVVLVPEGRRVFGNLSRAYVLDSGNLVLSGSAAQVAGDPAVKLAYLGG